MNNNGARNLALREGKKRAKWVLPWDGNCYLTPDAWNQIRQDVTSSPWYTHFVVPMARMLSNDDLINNVAPPDPVEEPQLIFRGDTECYFNEDYCYGRRPKVEFFWGIGIPGKWDRWKDDLWDIPRRSNLVEQQQFGLAGWVARLYSGMGNLEKDSAESFRNRGLARQEAIVSTLRHIDKKLNPGAANKSSLQIYSTEKIRELAKSYKAGKTSRLADSILQDAEEALTRGPFSVVDKTTLPPSGDPHDYWHPAPYWWPNPDTPDRLPYTKRDGERVPGTRLYEPDSDKYDRSRIQRVFDDSISLALAWKVSGEDKYIAHAADILKRFFVEPATRMNPHLNYAQVRMGINKNNGASTGLIEFKDLYYYLDAVRIIEQSGALSAEDIGSFSSWLSDYKTWLMESAQGLKESRGLNNHGTYYDLHLAAVAAYLGDESTLYETFARAQGRIVEQITPDGRQPNELGRKTSAHYCCYNLQGFLNLAKYAKNWGVDIWGYRSRSGSSLKGAVNWLVGYWGKEWPFEQIDPFDKERILALQFTALRMDMSADSARREMGNLDVKPRFFPHDGIQPYWELL